MKLIDDAGVLWHRIWSVRMSIISAAYSAAAGAWVLLPYAWQPTLSEPIKWGLAAAGVALAASPGIARVVAQPKLAEKVADLAKADDNSEHA